MLLEIIISIIAGIFFGIVTGLIPGIHANLVGSLIVSNAILLSNFPILSTITFLVSMAISQIFFDFLPSIFLGCPEKNTELIVLPGHKLLQEGKGYEAVALSTKGAFYGMLIFLIISPIFFISIPFLFNLIKNLTPYLLMGIILIMILTEKEKITAIIIVILTGLLGFCSLNINISEPLLPLLSGLFGVSGLIESIRTKIKIPPQIISDPKEKSFKPILSSLISSPLLGILPALSTSQAAILGSFIIKISEKGFLILLGATNMMSMCISFIAMYSLGKTRTGVTASITEIVGKINLKEIIFILGIVLISGIISYVLVKKISIFFSKIIIKINYTKLSIITIIIVSLLTVIISGISGLGILIISTLTGVYCIKQNVKKTLMMCCLIIPTILLYFGF